ncbi:glycosyltransferase [Arenibacter amylolyticus]|uniref:glycosyltransferase n=1 Tax=Arenibacter amylolyticus TaxID=1406873 RepID=UPI000A38388B|nr:glycosyltransferase [Arenibacter amylolyticus]
MKNICVVTAQSFPSGVASNNRILSYTKGLVELGNQVEVLSINKSETTSGEILGVMFSNLGRGANKVLTMISGIFNLIVLIFKKNYETLIVVSNNAIVLVLLYIVCKVRGITYIQEKSEFPFVLNYKGSIKMVFSNLYVRFIYRLFDGMIIMTEPLMDYFKNKTRIECKFLLMPMTVDITRFDKVETTEKYSNCITYCGYMGNNKDGVKNLIEAFSLIQDQHKNLNLLLLGTAPKKQLNEMKVFAENIAPGRVIFEGSVSRERIPYYLKNSKLLALARPSSLQSSGGFPTKLGEYLSTKKPVVVTAVGDIPKFLIDKENAFVVEPDNNKLFANKLSEIISEYDQALKVALQGFKLVNDVFNYKVQSKRLNEFLNTF